jgi:hypothetical protein
MRAEIKMPEKASVEDYAALMESYVRHYNEVRPHCALGYRTPKEVFEKTSALGSRIPDIVGMIEEAFFTSGSHGF